MSGHSKWNNIKAKKAKGDATRSKIFTKIGREIAVAVKAGGSDPSINSKLYDIVQKAKLNNMPNENITRSIKKAAGELGAVNYENMTYEGYGVGGSAVIVECLTDNKNRTAGDVRCYFDKCSGSLGTTNCVSFMFDKKGVIVAERDEKMSEDDVFELALDCGADDVNVEDEAFIINTSVSDFHNVRNSLTDKDVQLISADISWVPQTMVTLDADNLVKFTKMIDLLEDLDDVQNVYHNVDLPDDDTEE